MTFRPKNQTRICINLLLLGSILRRKVARGSEKGGTDEAAVWAGSMKAIRYNLTAL